MEEEEENSLQEKGVKPVLRGKGRRWRLRRSRRVSFEIDTPRIRRRAEAPPQLKKRTRRGKSFEVEPDVKSSFYPSINFLDRKSQMIARHKKGVLGPRCLPKQMYRDPSIDSFLQHGEANRVKVHVELNPRALENILDDFDWDDGETRAGNPTRTGNCSENNGSTDSEENSRIDQKSKIFTEPALKHDIEILPTEHRSSIKYEESIGLRKRIVCDSENSSDEEITLDSILASWGAV